MAEFEATLPGTVEIVEAALRAALEVGNEAPLEIYVPAEGKRIPLTFDVQVAGSKLPDAYGMTVRSRTVKVTASSPTSVGFRQTVSPKADRVVLGRAEELLAGVKEELPAELSVDRTYEVEHSFERAFDLARHDDIEAGILPFEFRDQDQTGAPSTGDQDLIVRKSDGSQIGTFWKGWGYGETVVRVHLTEATPEDARAVAAALRSWVRGQSMVDRPRFSEISF